MMKLLKERPCTREDLVFLTEFSKQRVCTVLSIYKLLKLVIEDPKTNFLYWNTEQALLIPDLTKYLQDLLQAKNIKRILARKVQQLSYDLLDKIKAKKGRNSKERNLGDQISTVIGKKLGLANNEEIKMKIEMRKNTVKDILELLAKRKEKLLQFGKNKVKFEKLPSIKIPSSYSCNNFNYSKSKKFSALNLNNKNKLIKNKLKFKTKKNYKKKKKYFKEKEFKKRLKKKYQYSKDTNSLYLKKNKNKNKNKLLKKKTLKKKNNKYYIKQKKKKKLKRTFSERKIKKIIVIRNRSLNISTRPQLKYKTKNKRATKAKRKINYFSNSNSDSATDTDSKINSVSDSNNGNLKSSLSESLTSYSDSISHSNSDHNSSHSGSGCGSNSGSIGSSQSYLRVYQKNKTKKRRQRKHNEKYKKNKKNIIDNQSSEGNESGADNQSFANEGMQSLLTLDSDYNLDTESKENVNSVDYEYDEHFNNNEYSIYYSCQIPFEIPQPSIESLNYFEKSNIQDDTNSLFLQNDLFETSITEFSPTKNLFETQSFNLINPDYDNQNSSYLSINEQKKNNHHFLNLKPQVEWNTNNQFKDHFEKNLNEKIYDIGKFID
ncbi:hypothetical protein M0813_15796 [Anaeramoeba flamelloides]|uniref:E2F/DP family winged-helix DNA-binding domain-containing protein n=1 Tax=Anaeramoeba flamelloides TaxID=1746091 RepID=A0ABQ8Z2E2_9EUKA|nr:hypothetical protein M0813_15796 [Anaeramoeba flamelloides]